MERNQNYTPEFRAEAVKMVLGQGLSLAEVAKRISLPKGTLRNWVASAKASTAPAAPGARTVAELEVEVKQLRKELAEARMERDILKKATAYFAREERSEGCRCKVRVHEAVATRISGGGHGTGSGRVPQRFLHLAEPTTLCARPGG